MEPSQQGQAAKADKAKKPNIWMIVSIILAVALVAVLVIKPKPSTEGDGERRMTLTVLSPEQVSVYLLEFINEIYGPQVGPVTVKDIIERNGLYQAVVNVLDPDGNPVDQVVFITPDAVLFIPQAIEIEAATTQYRALIEQQNELLRQQAADDAAADAAGEDEDEDESDEE